MHSNPKVILMGAGPGDPELITLKGIKALVKADAILHDSLSNMELLEYAKPGCKIINVGKRHGCKSAKQEIINMMLVHCAQKYGTVVRLKGGDPFVFGRGQEELEFVKINKISVEVISGISSAIAVPAAAGIPVTCRGVNESFWVTTGTLSNGDLSPDIQLAAQSSATVIILMGLHKIDRIMDIYKSVGKEDLPCAVIQDGTKFNQKVVTGTVQNISEKVHNKDIKSPAIIVIGEVVRKQTDYYIYNEMVKDIAF